MLFVITSTDDELFSSIDIDDLEPAKIGGSSTIFGCGAHFKGELRLNG